MAKALKSPSNRAASRPLARGQFNPEPTGRGLGDARRIHPARPHARARPERATRHAPLRAPTLAAFGRQWFQDLRVGWKPSNCESITCILEGVVYPMLGDRPVDSIRRSDLLAFRAEVMRTRPGRSGNKTIGNRRANRIMTVFQTVLREAALQLDFPDPCLQMKPLREPRADIQPFSLEEIGRLIEAAPTLFKDYILVRCLTAMRSGEINGLPWENVDFENRHIRVRAARVRG